LVDPQTLTVTLNTSFIPSNTDVSATIKSFTATVAFCNPKDMNCSVDVAVFGSITMPDVKVSKNSPTTFVNTTLYITNYTYFESFTRYLFANVNATMYVKGSTNVHVDFGSITINIDSINIRKNTTILGLDGLPGAYTNSLDFYTPDTHDRPWVNCTFFINNPGNTAYVPLGTSRWVWVYSPGFTNYSIPWERIAVVTAPNLTIYPGGNICPVYGPLEPHYLYGDVVWNRFFTMLVNATNTTLIPICSASPCCFQNKTFPPPIPPIPPVILNHTVGENCTCVPASEVPLYDPVLQNTPLFVTLQGTKINFVTRFTLLTGSLTPGGECTPQIGWQNPWGTSLLVDTFNVVLMYMGVTVGVLAGPTGRIAALPPYGTLALGSPNTPIVWPAYVANSTQAATLNMFFSAVQNGTMVDVKGAMGWRMGILPVTIDYWQWSVYMNATSVVTTSLISPKPESVIVDIITEDNYP